jgi:hypothetical protein
MPIVINEIEISVEVTPANLNGNTSANFGDALSKEAIIKECVEKVMEIINLQNER